MDKGQMREIDEKIKKLREGYPKDLRTALALVDVILKWLYVDKENFERGLGMPIEFGAVFVLSGFRDLLKPEVREVFDKALAAEGEISTPVATSMIEEDAKLTAWDKVLFG